MHWQEKGAGPPVAAWQIEPGPHTLPHVPQFGLASSGVHAPAHTMSPVAHAWHWPDWQFSPVAHLWPHVPQLFGSVAVAVQTPGLPATAPQTTSLFGHAPHAPAAHGSPVAQALPQASQLSGSVCRLVQTPAPAVAPLQSVSPFGQTHTPEMQEAPESQTLPQAPQLFVSVVVFTHPAVPHVVSPVPQTQAVTPAFVWHVEPVPQTTPHAPQLKLSLVKLTQAAGGPAHLFGSAAGQPQTPAAQVPPSAQAVPQVPQSVALVCRFSQPSVHMLVPVGQPHTPAVHAAPAAHLLPHAPQFAGSVSVVVHTAPHRLGSPTGQLQAPAAQVAPTAQAVPHAPQLLLSVCVFVHVPLQLSGVGAVQVVAPSVVAGASVVAFASVVTFASLVGRASGVVETSEPVSAGGVLESWPPSCFTTWPESFAASFVSVLCASEVGAPSAAASPVETPVEVVPLQAATRASAGTSAARRRSELLQLIVM